MRTLAVLLFFSPLASALYSPVSLPHARPALRQSRASSPVAFGAELQAVADLLPAAASSAASLLPAADVLTSPAAAGRGLVDTFTSVSNAAAVAPPDAEQISAVLHELGKDLLIFLSASVIVTPLASRIKITPILLYLIFGALLGPNGFNFFANNEADVELGDFGILFLLFNEGLEVSTSRIKSLTQYLPLGIAQLSVTSIIIAALIVLGAPEALERFLPLDGGLINIQNPSEAMILGIAGALSSSAFIFPVLAQKGWEQRPAGFAAVSILLFQDLAVAPLLVLLPYLAGQGVTDPAYLTELVLKATVGFAAVLAVGSYCLRWLFDIVTKTESSETFVALCLLVAVGMGTIVQGLGLTNTAGAFAAGVLLANTNYRAQIQTDIRPLEGILLGIFFMTAGAKFDAAFVANEWVTVLTGVICLLITKAAVLGPAALASNIPKGESLRLAMLLAGGGEFAFIVIAEAEKLDALNPELSGLLTAVILIAMAITPVVGDVAEKLSAGMETSGDAADKLKDEEWQEAQKVTIAHDAVVICGFDDVGSSTRLAISRLDKILPSAGGTMKAPEGAASIACFDRNPQRVIQGIAETAAGALVDGASAPRTAVLYGDGASAALLSSAGISAPRAIFICYSKPAQVKAATMRLREKFSETPIFARAANRDQVNALMEAGATDVVVETDEVALQFAHCISDSAVEEIRLNLQLALEGEPTVTKGITVEESARLIRNSAAEAGVSVRTASRLYSLFASFDLSKDGTLQRDEVARIFGALKIGASVNGMNNPTREMTAAAEKAMAKWIADADSDEDGVINFSEFLIAYMDPAQYESRDLIEQAFEALVPLSDQDRSDAAAIGISDREASRLYRMYTSLDTSGDGIVEVDEVKELLMQGAVGDQDGAIDKYIVELDADGDGTVSFVEFCQLSKKMVGSVSSDS